MQKPYKKNISEVCTGTINEIVKKFPWMKQELVEFKGSSRDEIIKIEIRISAEFTEGIFDSKRQYINVVTTEIIQEFLDSLKIELESLCPGTFLKLVERVKKEGEYKAPHSLFGMRLLRYLLNSKKVFDDEPFFLAIALAIAAEQALSEGDNEKAIVFFNNAGGFVIKGDLLTRTLKRKAYRQLGAAASDKMRDPARNELIRLIGTDHFGNIELSYKQAISYLEEKITEFVERNYDIRPKKTKEDERKKKDLESSLPRAEKDKLREEERKQAEKFGKWPGFDSLRWLKCQLENDSGVRDAFDLSGRKR